MQLYKELWLPKLFNMLIQHFSIQVSRLPRISFHC